MHQNSTYALSNIKEYKLFNFSVSYKHVVIHIGLVINLLIIQIDGLYFKSVMNKNGIFLVTVAQMRRTRNAKK